MREQIASALDVIIHVQRLGDGSRRVSGITEVVGMEGDVIALQDIFVFQRTGVTQEGRVEGHYRATGIRPKFADQLAIAGYPMPAEVFAEGRVI
jgi:pilus assembly protein CpaF